MGYELAVTPLQLAAAYGALANGGVLLEPTLVREVRGPDGAVAWRATPRPVRRAVPRTVASQLVHMMTGVVEEGTARRAALGTYNVAGKTGTARRNVGGHYLEGHYWASFVGLFPADDPQLVLVVKIDDPQGEYFGGTTAAPVVRTILEAALATPAVALDRGRLTRRRAPDAAAPAAAPADGAPIVVAWPPAAAPTRRGAPGRAVPDVDGPRAAGGGADAAPERVRGADRRVGTRDLHDPGGGRERAPGHDDRQSMRSGGMRAEALGNGWRAPASWSGGRTASWSPSRGRSPPTVVA